MMTKKAKRELADAPEGKHRLAVMAVDEADALGNLRELAFYAAQRHAYHMGWPCDVVVRETDGSGFKIVVGTPMPDGTLRTTRIAKRQVRQ